GFTLGDGLFETIRMRGGRPVALDRHLARLADGLARVAIRSPWDAAALAAAIGETLAANRLEDAVVRLTVSRGVARRRGLLFEPDLPPTVVVQAEPFAGYPSDFYERGMRLITSPIRRDERSPLTRLQGL